MRVMTHPNHQILTLFATVNRAPDRVLSWLMSESPGETATRFPWILSVNHRFLKKYKKIESLLAYSFDLTFSFATFAELLVFFCVKYEVRDFAAKQ